MKQTIILVAVLLFGLFGCSSNNDEEISASGTIEGTDVNVGSEVFGKVKELRVGEGSQVENGDTLVIIDDTDYQLQIRQAVANLQGTEAQYRLALEGFRREDVLQAEANYKAAEADYNRMKDLLSSRTVTQKQFDDAEARYVSAEQTYEKLSRGLRKDEIVAARAKRDQAAAQVDILRKKVRDCTIVSPVRGTVTLKGIEEGELVNVGSNLVRITYLEKVDLTIYAAESELGRIRLGQTASVTIDTYSDRTFRGKVIYVSPIAEFTPKNVQTKDERSKLVYGVKIEVENPDGALKPGMPADARLETAVDEAD